jgi:hypothetical protein
MHASKYLLSPLFTLVTMYSGRSGSGCYERLFWYFLPVAADTRGSVGYLGFMHARYHSSLLQSLVINQ